MDAFSQSKSLGSKDRLEIIRYLLEIGDDAAAKRFSGHGGGGQALASRFFGVDQWANTGILLGYIADRSSGSSIDIQNAVTLAPDDTLKGGRIKITLDKFYVQSYPGHGAHTILCEFTGKNQISGGAEEKMRFALTTTANDRSGSGVSGEPIFLGVSVGQDGIAFEGRTINVRSSTDDTLMEALGSDTFRNGLALLTSVQPALKPFVGLAGALSKLLPAEARIVKSILSSSASTLAAG